MVRKVKYIDGSGCILRYPLSDGRFEFYAGIIYTINNYDDFMRLISSNSFVEITNEKKQGDKN